MAVLSPPLAVIERSLLGPSETLIERWADGDPSLSAEMLARLEADPGAREQRTLWTAAQAEPPIEAVQGEPLPEMPVWLHELVDRREAARAGVSQDKPKVGQILRVDRAVGPDGPLDWDFPQPLAVAISAPATGKDLWSGWMVAPETDYATQWDVVLGEADEPLDPLAGMVQLWNPVHLYIPSTSAALGQLSSERLATLRAGAVDYARRTARDPAEACPGSLVERWTSAGHLLLTGTPLGDESDPRWRYQALYWKAARRLRELAELASDRRSLVELLWERLVAAALQAGRPLVPEPTPVTMGPADEELPEGLQPANVLAGRLRIESSASGGEGGYSLRVSLKGGGPMVAKLMRGTSLMQVATLDSAAPMVEFFAGPNQALRLVIEDAAANTWYEAQLP